VGHLAIYGSEFYDRRMDNPSLNTIANIITAVCAVIITIKIF
jgi:hypothetical protein